MSLADEVLAEHTKASLGDYCSVCHDQWPCESVRLAAKLKAAEQVVEAAREWGLAREAMIQEGPLPARGPSRLRLASDHLADTLAEYDKGGQG